MRAGLLSREIHEFRVPTLSHKRKATSPAAFSRVAGGPCAVEEPGHARTISMRENREIPRLPVVSVMPRPGWFAGWQTRGRAVRGTLRR